MVYKVKHARRKKLLARGGQGSTVIIVKIGFKLDFVLGMKIACMWSDFTERGFGL